MKDGLIRIGAVTPDVVVADPMSNAEAHIRAAHAACEDGVRVLAFPELSLSTYALSDLFCQPGLLTACEEALVAFVQGTRDLDMISFVGVPVRVGGKLYNCAAAVHAGRVLGLVPKTYIPNGGYTEGRYFTPAPAENTTVQYAGGETTMGTHLLFRASTMPSLVIAAEICHDLWVATPPSSMHAAAGATLVVNLSASPEVVGKASYRRDLISVQSARTRTAYVYAAAGRGESGTDMVFAAHNMIVDCGSVKAENKPFHTPAYVTAEVDLEKILFERVRASSFGDIVPPAYTEVSFALGAVETALRTPISATPFIPAGEEEKRERCETILNIQSHGLAARVQRAHAKTMVLGVSGGLDSTLALLAAVRAADLSGMDRHSITAVTMPCFGTTHRTRSNAETLSERLGTALRVVDIKEAVDVHFRDIGHDPANHNVVYENAQARERTQVLMDIANAEGGLVVGTGDLSELALGWATYNGDHMSMYGVNADVPKTLVRHIVACEADRFEAMGDQAVASVLRDILATPVSPELLPPDGDEIAQCTEGIVGPYELHDFFLYYMVRCGYTPAKILRVAHHAFGDAYDADTIRRWLQVFVRRFFTQQFKRSCLPDGPKVGSVSLSPRGDWGMPSDASSAVWLKDLT